MFTEAGGEGLGCLENFSCFRFIQKSLSTLVGSREIEAIVVYLPEDSGLTQWHIGLSA